MRRAGPRVNAGGDLGARFERLEDLPANIAVLDGAGTIVRVNRHWKRFAAEGGLRDHKRGLGLNYLETCVQSLGESSKLVRDLKGLLAGAASALTFAYPCDTPKGRRWFMLLGLPLSTTHQEGAVLLHLDITSLLPDFGSPDEAPQRAAPETLPIDRRGNAQVDGLIAAAVEFAVERAMSAFVEQSKAAIKKDEEAEAAVKALDHIRDVLSRRQFEVFTLIGEGNTNRQIADALSMSPNTVKLHVSAILKRLGLSSRTQAAVLASKVRKVGEKSDVAKSA